MKTNLFISFCLLLSLNSYCQDTIVFELVANINQEEEWNGDGSSFPHSLTVVGDKVFFSAQKEQDYRQLFVLTAATDTVEEIVLNNYHSGIANQVQFCAYQDGVVFTGNAGYGNFNYEPWFSDGTASGTYQIKDLYPGEDSGGGGGNYIVYNGIVYFGATVLLGSELYHTDLTEQGTDMFMNIAQGSSYPHEFTIYNDILYFSAAESNLVGDELWRTDGTVQGTMMLKDLSTESGGGSPSRLIVFQDSLYFSAYGDGIGGELWVSDGTEAGTVVRADINLEPGVGSFPDAFTPYGNGLVFTATDSAHGRELWTMTNDSVYMIKDVWSDGDGLSYARFHEYNEVLYFRAKNSQFGDRIMYRTDGTDTGTYEVTTLDGESIEEPTSFANWNGHMVFIAENQFTENSQFWILYEDSVYPRRLFPDSIVGWSSVGQQNLVPFEGDLYFTSSLIDSLGSELYRLTSNISRINSLEEIALSLNLSIYPNPVTASFRIACNKKLKKAELRIYNMLGTEVYHSSVHANSNINLSPSWSNGTYLVQVVSDDFVAEQQLVILR